jgi:signal recognition particle subunit SEC65
VRTAHITLHKGRKMPKQVIVRKDETEEAVTISLGLARLLASERKDYKSPNNYEEVQQITKKLLQVLLSVKD